MKLTRLTETAEYDKKRDELRLAEIELMQQQEQVAQMRRELPVGAAITDYEFVDIEPERSVRMSELFTAPDRPLIVYHFMYGKAQTTACPMCTCWLDGFNGIAHHVAQNADLVVVAAADPATLRSYAESRGWDQLRLLSAGDSTFKYDLLSEDEDGSQDSTISVFTRDADGTTRHRYTSHPWMSDDIRQRGIDLLNPVWNLLDLTPPGRDDWYAALNYD
jgi:predicted dithiol-disulfide oxidoreductase (DUF899 family)